MKNARDFVLAMVTVPDLKCARKLANLALTAKLAACVNVLGGIESHYWWKNKMEKGSEMLMLFKTRQSNLKLLEKLILSEHPYDTAEFIVLPVNAGAERYLRWWQESLA